MKGLPKLVLTDIDGVWTDAGMYYDNTGNELKKFNTSDSAGLIFLRHLNIPIGIITGENTKIVANRAAKLDIDLLYQGIKDKVAVLSMMEHGEFVDEVGMRICDEIVYVMDTVEI